MTGLQAMPRETMTSKLWHVTKEQQRELILALTNVGMGESSTEDSELHDKLFYPVPEHIRAFEPAVTLIVGDRGSGKSALFRTVFEKDLLGVVASHAPHVRLPQLAPAHARWLPAHPVGSEFPDARGLQTFMQQQPQDPRRSIDFWFAYLMRVVAGEILPAHQQAVAPIGAVPAADPMQVHDAFLHAGTGPLIALDALDRHLRESNAWLFIGYDELDTLGGFDTETVSWAIRGLIGFWATYHRRWERLRAKIFIRPDLFRHHADLGGADLLKLAANRVELRWNDRNLLAMLIKRIANTDERLKEYCTARMAFQNVERLGWIPLMSNAEDARPLIERMIGIHMGASVKKGLSFRWILDRVRDSHGNATPRALIMLLQKAAENERDVPRQNPPQLLHPTALRLALEDVSRSHVTQAVSSEWPWLHGVKERLNGQGVPWERKRLEDLLSKDWSRDWGNLPGLRPPASDPRSLVDYLVEARGLPRAPERAHRRARSLPLRPGSTPQGRRGHPLSVRTGPTLALPGRSCMLPRQCSSS